MGYSCIIRNPDGTRHEFAQKHNIRGGTYAIGGTREAWLSITYNYSRFFNRDFKGGKGLDIIDGMTLAESIPLIIDARSKLNRDDNKGPSRAELIGGIKRKVELLTDKEIDYTAPPQQLEEQVMSIIRELIPIGEVTNLDRLYIDIIEDKLDRLKKMGDAEYAELSYWDPRESNAYDVLTNLLLLAVMAPSDCTWQLYR